jgi:hypothetical protein
VPTKPNGSDVYRELGLLPSRLSACAPIDDWELKRAVILGIPVKVVLGIQEPNEVCWFDEMSA